MPKGKGYKGGMSSKGKMGKDPEEEMNKRMEGKKPSKSMGKKGMKK